MASWKGLPVSRPKRAVQRPILDSLRDVAGFDGFGGGEVGHGACNSLNAAGRSVACRQNAGHWYAERANRHGGGIAHDHSD
jgi:hypothetical protein